MSLLNTTVGIMNSENPYETEYFHSQYCEFHYGSDYFGVPNFPARCAGLCVGFMKERRVARALDIGCSVGRTAFELARIFSRVTGIDSSASFIKSADAIRASGSVIYNLPVEGELYLPVERNLSDFRLDQVCRRVEFIQADASMLPDDVTGYDLIFAGNLIDRLEKPRRFLSSLHERMNPGGVLVLTSPYTWLPAYTPRDEWLGGFWKNGRHWTSRDGLKAILQPNFRLLTEPFDVPFVLRETARKFQHSLAEMTAWELSR